MAATHELSEGERRSVQGVISRALSGPTYAAEFAFEGGRRPGSGFVRSVLGAGGPCQLLPPVLFTTPCQEPTWRWRQRHLGGPEVAIAGGMDAGRRDYVAAVAPDVESRAKEAGAVADLLARVGKPVVAPTAAGPYRRARRETAVRSLKLDEGRESSVVRVDIEDDEAAGGAGS